jgi:hypothetical protein
MAGLLLGGAGGWALSSTGHDGDFRERPSLVGFPGQPAGPGVVPGPPQPGHGDLDGDDDGGQNS